jgi:hypothetical protein
MTQESGYTLVTWQPIILRLRVHLRVVLKNPVVGYYIVLYGDCSKCGSFIIVKAILHIYHTYKWVTVNKHYITYWSYGSLLSSQFV